ncbi:hypothetical protein ACFPLB_02725 [Aquamicrobium segne]|uniref:Uncharacterized protein n=1 Tax=Aquamicrobium segne TaxID=469547 RepID=A0ABW0GUJ9_9HYPH
MTLPERLQIAASTSHDGSKASLMKAFDTPFRTGQKDMARIQIGANIRLETGILPIM